MTINRDTVRLRSALTLVEVLTVLSILTGLIAILMPAVNRARQAAQRTQCISNIRQSCLGMNQYLELRNFPDPDAVDVAGGWSVRVLCYLDEEPLMQLIDGVPLAQMPLAANQRPRVLSCPSNPANESIFPPIQTGHYASNGRSISDVPLDYGGLHTTGRLPWLVSPIEHVAFESREGPHDGLCLIGDIYDCSVRSLSKTNRVRISGPSKKDVELSP